MPKYTNLFTLWSLFRERDVLEVEVSESRIVEPNSKSKVYLKIY